MRYFLVVYDRSAGALREVVEYPEDQRDEALNARFARELKEREHPNIEVVLLGAPSEAALRRTHGRYFKTMQELVEQL